MSILRRVGRVIPTAVAVLSTVALAGAQVTVPVSVDGASVMGNRSSGRPDFDFFARYVVFESEADNLVPNDTNGCSDIFVRDLVNGTTRRVSVSSSGAQANRGSLGPAISASGHIVAFSSYATNLVVGDNNDNQDVFIHDLRTGETKLVSLATTGEQANEDCYNPTLDEGGRFVVYESIATNLVPNDTNHKVDVFHTDIANLVTTRVSVATGGIEGNGHSGQFPRWSFTSRISHDGDRIVFPSASDNLVPGDTNGTWDVFMHDTTTGTTIRLSEAAGVGGNAASMHADISHGGHIVAFVSEASNLVPGDLDNQEDVFVKDLNTGAIERVSLTSIGLASTQSRKIGAVRISGDGRLVSFPITASDIVPGDFNGVADIVVHDRMVGSTFRASMATDFGESNGLSDFSTISGDGSSIAFESMANNLGGVDTNGDLDVFVHRIGPEQWRNYGPGTPGTSGVPSLVVQGTPRLGNTFQIVSGNSAGIVALGAIVFGTNFADLPILGQQFLVQPDLFIALPVPAAGLTVNVSLPTHPSLIHADGFVQVLHEDLGAPAGFAFTRGLEINFY